MEWKYTRTGDYELPNLTLNDNKKGTINKYGMLRLNYLKHNKKALYTTLLMKDKLTSHLVLVSKDAEILLNNLIESYKKRDEKLFERTNLYWKYVSRYSHIVSSQHWICTPAQILLWEFPAP